LKTISVISFEFLDFVWFLGMNFRGRSLGIACLGNVGVSIFGSYAFSAVPLTYDMKSIAFLLDFFDVGIAGDSTAIGEGIANATRVLEKGEAKKKVIILITDGFQNSGEISVKEAVEIAVKKGIIIYSYFSLIYFIS